MWQIGARVLSVGRMSRWPTERGAVKPRRRTTVRLTSWSPATTPAPLPRATISITTERPSGRLGIGRELPSREKSSAEIESVEDVPAAALGRHLEPVALERPAGGEMRYARVGPNARVGATSSVL